MKRLIWICLFLGFSTAGFAQKVDTVKKESEIICLCCGPIDPAKAPIYVVNEKIITYNILPMLDPAQIESITVLRQSEAGIYREQAKNGTVVIKMKKQIRWVSIETILSKKERNLMANKVPVYFKDQLLTLDSILIDEKKKLIIRMLDSSSITPVANNYAGKYLSITEI